MLQVALSEVLGALSYALDITEGEPPGHAVRTTAIGMRLGEQLGLDDDQRSALFYALLLKDAGCSSNASRLSSLFAADDHAAKRAMKVTDWSRTGALAKFTWQAVTPGGSPLAKAKQMRRITQEEEVTRPLEDARNVPPVAAWEPADRVITAGDDRLDRVADAFARVIDAKSPFTARHSSEVARWAVAAGRVLGLDSAGLHDLHRAGLLHDIGKLAVSNRILDKPGKLDESEMAAMREHPRYTHEILNRVACLRPIVDTAANHHERLDGKGYHRGLAAFDLTRPARILAAADVYEALTADRPYRAAMPTEKALSILREERGTGLCPTAVDAIAIAAGDPPAWTLDFAVFRSPTRVARSQGAAGGDPHHH